MNKITKPMILNFFMHLCNDMGKKAYVHEDDLKAVKAWATDSWKVPCEIVPYNTPDCWSLDKGYGGWIIEEYQGNCPMGHCRYPMKQFFNMICFAREALRISKVKQ